MATKESRAHFREACQQFLKLPLEQQAEHVSEFLTTLFGPSKIRQTPGLQNGIRSVGNLSSATLREFKNLLKPYYLGIAIRTKVELTELVTFGDRIMSSEIKHKIISWGKANGWSLSDADLVRRAEKCIPFSYACTKAANAFQKEQKILPLKSLYASEVSREIVDEVCPNFYTDDIAVGHIFKNKLGHLPIDTPANRELLLNVAKDPRNFLGIDKWGNWWFGKNLENGTQIWAEVRPDTGRLFNGGLNLEQKIFNRETGLSSQVKPKG